ncbi:MAG: hypothetical protein AB4041_20875 [Microcystaceae cyanobacterium]
MSQTNNEEKKRAIILLWTFIVLLVGGFAVYFYCHSIVKPQGQQLSQSFSNTLTDAKSNIDDAQKLLGNTNEESIKQLETTILKLEPLPRKINEQISSLNERQINLLEEVNTDITNLVRQIRNDPNTITSSSPQINELLSQGEQNIQKVLIQDTTSYYFWENPPLLWLEITFWGFVGTTLYLLSEIYTHYKSKEDEQKFIELTPWYFINLIRGTFIVFIVLLGLSTVQIGIGEAVNLSKAPATFYVFLAAVLGYFNRMAKEQLKLIVKGVFPDAWNLANPDDLTAKGIDPNVLTIIPSESSLTFGESVSLKIKSGKTVNWSKRPDIGSFSLEKGAETTYTFPSLEAAKGETKVTIIAKYESGEKTQEATAIINLEEQLPMLDEEVQNSPEPTTNS